MTPKKKTKKSSSFWADGLSINETKFSTLMLMSFIGIVYALYSHFATGDITANLLDLAKFLVLSVVGVNGVNAVTGALQGRRENKGTDTYNGDVDETDKSDYDQYK